MVSFRAWLESVSLEKYHETFVSNSVDLDILTELNEDDLAELGLNLGDRKRMLLAIKDLQVSRESELRSKNQETKTHLATETPEVYAHFPEPEKRQLTLVFVDLVGSTQLASELSLEDYRAALHAYRNCCEEIIQGGHGHVAHFVGDGIVCYFGYPNAEENDAERAVVTALEMCSAVPRIRLRDGRSLQVRVGVSSGVVVVDESKRHGGLVLGQVPNLAARVQSTAKPGTVAISVATKELIGENVTCEWTGYHDLKGFSEPVGIWRVLDVDANNLRFQARQSGSITRLVGRSDELHLLESLWQAAKNGDGRTVLLSGEAGIGKSRLVEELSTRTAGDSCLRLNFQCSPSHETSSYYPLISFVNHLVGITRDETTAKKLAKLKRLVSNWSNHSERTLATIAILLSIPMARNGSISQSTPDRQREEIQDTLVTAILTLANKRPLLLLFEDIHWIDPSTEEVIDLLIEKTQGARVLTICTFRPGYTPRWAGLAGVTTLTLPRLDRKHAQQLLGNLIAEHPFARDFQSQILAKADGVPLFVEEMARVLRERGSQAESVPITDTPILPSTLKELLQATIDKMSSARVFLPVCAAIGINIMPSMAKAVADQSASATQEAFDRMVDAHILVPRGSGRNTVFSFRHALIRDAAYDLMLPSRARSLHQRIAEVMSGSFDDLAKRHPEILAQHYSIAEMPKQALDAWRAAAVVASGRSATEETIQHLNAALLENGKLTSKSVRNRGEFDLRKMLNVALNTRAFGSKDVIENYQRLHALLGLSDADLNESFLALHVQFGAQLMLSDPQGASGLCKEMASLAERADDPTLRSLAAHDIGMNCFMLGNLNDAIEAYDRALQFRSLTTRQNILKFHAADINIVDIAMRGWARALREGNTEAVRDELKAGFAETRVEPHEFSRCFGLNMLAAAYQVVDDSASLLKLVDAALDISSKRKFRYWDAWSGILRGWARARQGEHAAGIPELLAAIEDYLQTGSTQIVLYARTLLADTYLMVGDRERGLLAINQVRQDELKSSVRYQMPLTDRIEAALRET